MGTGSLPPSTIDDLDRIIDLYYYEQVPSSSPNVVSGGAGAYCYYGPAELARLGNTPLETWVNGLMFHIADGTPTGEDFRVDYEGRLWRACRDESDVGTQVSFRRLPASCPSLDDLKFGEPMIRDILKGRWLNDGGLILFCGLTGQGKTTQAAATVRNRLERFGGRCVTVEDVPEVPLEGLWGSGSCRQLRVDHHAQELPRRGFAGAIRRAYRTFPATRPAILYIGEVRDTETAVEVVKAAANGMLVITTVHSFDPASALLRLSTLAKGAMGDAANLALSQALRVVIHQSLELQPDVVGWARGSFAGNVLISDGPAHPLANMIRTDNYAQMAQIQSTQKIRIEHASRRGMLLDDLLTSIGSSGDA